MFSHLFLTALFIIRVHVHRNSRGFFLCSGQEVCKCVCVFWFICFAMCLEHSITGSFRFFVLQINISLKGYSDFGLSRRKNQDVGD